MNNDKKLSRIDHVREETKRALEFGILAPSSIPLSNNFRTEGLAPIPFSHDPLASPAVSTTFNHQGNKTGILKTINPYEVKMNPKILYEALQAQVGMINEDNRSVLAPEMLNSFSQLASQTQEYDKISSLHKEILTKLFGDEYFKNGGEANVKGVYRR